MKKDDIVTAAIARAQGQLDMPENKKVAANIQSLSKRLINAYKTLNNAKAENSDNIDHLQQSVDKLKREVDRNRQLLKAIKANMALTASRDNTLSNSMVNSNNGLNNEH